MVMATEERLHPLQMGEEQLRDRLVVVERLIDSIDNLVRARIDDPHQADVHPELENERSQLDTERLEIERELARIERGERSSEAPTP